MRAEEANEGAKVKPALTGKLFGGGFASPILCDADLRSAPQDEGVHVFSGCSFILRSVASRRMGGMRLTLQPERPTPTAKVVMRQRLLCPYLNDATDAPTVCLFAPPHGLTMGSISEGCNMYERQEMDATVKPWRVAFC